MAKPARLPSALHPLPSEVGHADRVSLANGHGEMAKPARLAWARTAPHPSKSSSTAARRLTHVAWVDHREVVDVWQHHSAVAVGVAKR